MLPCPAFAISAPSTWAQRKVPVTFTSSDWRKRATGYASNRDCSAALAGSSNLSLIAALFTSTSMRPAAARILIPERLHRRLGGDVRADAERAAAELRRHPGTGCAVEIREDHPGSGVRQRAAVLAPEQAQGACDHRQLALQRAVGRPRVVRLHRPQLFIPGPPACKSAKTLRVFLGTGSGTATSTTDSGQTLRRTPARPLAPGSSPAPRSDPGWRGGGSTPGRSRPAP